MPKNRKDSILLLGSRVACDWEPILFCRAVTAKKLLILVSPYQLPRGTHLHCLIKTVKERLPLKHSSMDQRVAVL